MRSKPNFVAVSLLAAVGCSCSWPVESQTDVEQAVHRDTSDIGLDVFGFSLHANRGAHYNEVNPGLGLRYAFWHPRPGWTMFGDTGIYYDSRRNWAKYAALGLSYHVTESWSVGAAVAYGQSRTYHHGTPFFAPVPGIAFEYRGVTFNTVLLPSEQSNTKIAGLAFFVTSPLAHRD